MVQLYKPYMPDGSEILQDDHYRRLNDLTFRHLCGAHEKHEEKSNYEWIKDISQDDNRYGNSEYLRALGEFSVAESEEYTQSLATVVFAQAWLVSAANYYRSKGNLKAGRVFTGVPELASNLQVESELKKRAEELKELRNAILHLSDNNKVGLSNLGFPEAYRMVKTSWDLYCKILERAKTPPDDGHWKIQTSRYGLPSEVV